MKTPEVRSAGFAHPVLLVVILVALVGLIGYSGQRVLRKEKQSSQTTTPVTDTANAVGFELEQPQTISVGSSNTAAAQVPQSTSSSAGTQTQVQVNTGYDLTTPLGSLNHLISELKARNFSNALYFITPRFMFQSAKAAKTVEPVTVDKCLANAACKNFMNTDVGVIDTNQIFDYSAPSVSAEGKSLKFNMTWKDGKLISQHPRYGGEYRVQVDMLNITTHWVVDRVTVNDIVI